MTMPRRDFLSALFRILDEKKVPYCVLRNYQNIYEDLNSDVDLAVEPEHVLACKECLAAAAAESGHHFVLRARYVNFSYVYWHPEGGFLRIDVETEVRWRFFPVLTSKSVILLRRKEGAFYIPHPRHESAIIWVAAIWREYLSERYRLQLARLYQRLANPQELERTFRACFGRIGTELAKYQASLPDEVPDRQICRAARWSIIRNAWRDRPSRRALFTHFLQDMGRVWERLRQPPGISVLYASSASLARDLKDFFDRIKFLYPAQKSETHLFDLSPAEGPAIVKLGVWLRARRLYALFKGGLFMRLYLLPDQRQIPRVVRNHTRYLYPSRTFVWTEDTRFRTCLGHIETGFIAELDPLDGAMVSNDRIIRFIAAVLEHYRRRREQSPGKRGAQVALVGRDDSARNNVARLLCALGPEQERFDRIRYFRWPFSLEGETLFPLPEFGHASQPPQPQNPRSGSRLPVIPACRRLLATKLFHWFRVRPLLRRNSLVLVDGCDGSFFGDSASAESPASRGALARSLSFCPQPDLLVVFKTPAVESRARNAGPSEGALLGQNTVPEQRGLGADRVLEVDAASPAPEVARAILQKIIALAP